MAFDGIHHGEDSHHGDSHISHDHSHTSHSHSGLGHSGGNHHSIHINHNEHGGMNSVTVHHPGGLGVTHQGLSSHDTHIHTTDGHNHIVHSTSGHDHGHNYGHGHDYGHGHHYGHGSSGNLGHIQNSSDPLSQASHAQFPSFKL